MTISPQTCDKCGQIIPPKPTLFANQPTRQRVYEIIARRTDGISCKELMDIVYDWDPNGGPENSKVIAVHIWLINKTLRALGLRIGSTRGRGAVYRLVKL